MSRGAKRALVAILLVIACGTASSGATFTASSDDAQGFSTATDFGVHVAVTEPTAPLRGIVSIGATATETAGGTLTGVLIERSPAGAGTWTTICADPGAPWSCSLNTAALADGRYDLRARATSSSGYARTSVVVAGVLVDNASPSVTIEDPGAWFAGTVTLRSVSGDNAGGSGVATVRYERRPSAGTTWTTVCTASGAPFSCSFDASALTPNGTAYDFRAVATDGAGNSMTSAAVTNRRVDNGLPTGTLADPGAYLRATVTLTASPADADSGVASARIQFRTAGTGTWTDVCTDTSSPYTCDWDTTGVTSGLYDLRMIATDMAGNPFTSPVVAGRRVDNILPSVSVTDPGSPLSGTITLNASASDAESGVRDVRIEYSAAGAGTWGTVCTDPTTPYQCTANTAGVADGLYDFRAVAADNAANEAISATVANRRVDNFAPSGADVQTADGGGTQGVVQPGDSITLTYSEDIDPSSIVAGWNGSGGQTVHVRFTHSNQGDRLLFYNASNNATIPLAGGAGVILNGEYVASAGTYSGALTTTGDGFRVTLIALTSGALRTAASPAATMSWTPANGARDLVGRACTTTARPELGAGDPEF